MRTRQTRRAFTLVELLVATALIALIMVILAQAFVDGLQAFRQLKAAGDLQENLRSAVVPLRNDLMTPHFQGSAKLSDSQGTPYTPPTQGYFRLQTGTFTGGVYQANSSWLQEGLDGNGLPSYTATNHILSFTVQLLGPRRSDYLSTTAPMPPLTAALAAPQDPSPLWQQGGTPDFWQSGPPAFAAGTGLFLSQSAEVCWFLTPLIDPNTNQQLTATIPNGGGTATPLWSLCRRQRLLLSSNAVINAGAGRIQSVNFNLFPEVSCRPDPNATPANQFLYFNTLTDVIQPAKRAFIGTDGLNSVYPMGTAYPSNSFIVASTPAEDSSFQANDIVISNVVSFEVQLLFAGDSRFRHLDEAQTFFSQPVTGVFDTATATPAMYRVLGVQVTIRVYDPKTEQTRQITMMQDT